jgi:hypothetical protein
MKASVSEQELRDIVKQVVQTGGFDRDNLTFTPEQQERIDNALEIYQRRDKSKPLQGEFPSTRKLGKARVVPRVQTGADGWPECKCRRCGEPIRLIKTGHTWTPYELQEDNRHICDQDRLISGGAFETNRRRH